jgi:hypothetical protein
MYNSISYCAHPCSWMLGSLVLAITKCLLAGNGGLSALLPTNIPLFISRYHTSHDMLYLVLGAMHHPSPPSFSREGAVAIHCSCREIKSREERFTLILTNITPLPHDEQGLE